VLAAALPDYVDVTLGLVQETVSSDRDNSVR
jgi:hypothetical protein